MNKAQITADFEATRIKAGILVAQDPIDADELAVVLQHLNFLMDQAAVYKTLFYRIRRFIKLYREVLYKTFEFQELLNLGDAIEASAILNEAENILDAAEDSEPWDRIAQFSRVLNAMKAMKTNVEALFDGLDDADGTVNEVKHVVDTLKKAIKEVTEALEKEEDEKKKKES